MDPLRFKQLGVKVGLEIHQQLNTRRKLFCHCPCVLEPDASSQITRYLRVSQSELGEVDQAAEFEAQKRRETVYKHGESSSCLVEADEEPPHSMDVDSIETGVTIALLLKSTLVDEVNVMRKIVIDGSNTTGFQRTAMIALGGTLDAGDRSVGVQTLTLEEDAARLLEDASSFRVYGLDRLGVPLIEIALAPIEASPPEVQEVALALGKLLRSTRRVARGLGSIRQDLNVSISGGEIIEVKGVQKLDLLSKIITYEAERQAALKTIAKLLSERKATQEAIPVEPVDISRLMEKTKSKVLRKVLDTGGVISAAALPSFRGLLALEPYPGVRLGKELADVARTHGLGGIIHSDELPAYGIELDEVTMIARQLSLDDDDAFVILAGNRETTGSAGRALLRRVREAFRGPIAETRGPTSDGQTRYLRPRPGAARLYPETDVPPIRIEEDYIAMVKKHLPPTWHTQIEELTSQHGLAHPVAEELLASDYLDLFQRLVKETHLSAPYLAASLIETLKALSREGVDLDSINDDELAEFFLAIDSGRIAKEGFPDLVREYAKDHSLGMEAVITRLGLSTLSEEEVRVAIRQEIEASRDLIRSRGRDAFKGLMGSVMAKMRGRIDGKKVSSLLQEEIETFMRKSD